MGVEIPQEQVCLSEVSPTVHSASELEECLMVSIVYLQKDFQENWESEDEDSKYEYVELESEDKVDGTIARRPSHRN